jgi:transposase
MKVYIGIDWSEQKHAVCFMNEAGGVIQELEIAHTPEGFLRLEQARQDLGVAATEACIGLETAHNLLMDFLVEQGYPNLYVLPPSLVKSNQSRFAHSGAKDDRRDARLIADILRTDLSRLSVWQPNTSLASQMRAKVSLIIFLTHSIVRHTNRLRAVLLRYYPAGLVVFAKLDTPIALAFLKTYPNDQAANQLSYPDFTRFARQHHHTRPSEWPKCYARLTQPRPTARPEVVQTYQPEALLLVDLLWATLQAKQQALHELQQLYQQHPDRPIFASLPGAGAFLEPALLAKLGDVRERFPSPATLQAIAGTSPYTKQSGKRRSIHFRFACDRELRYLVQQWAAASLRKSPWAVSYYTQAYRHCGSKKAALRRLANRWLSVLWKLWQTHTLYDEQYHLQQRALRAKPRA